MRHYKDLIEAYVQYTSGHESTDRLRKWCLLSVLAGALERRVYMERGYYTLYPNLYVFIIGRSGIIKKSTSTSIAVNILREVKGIKMMSERLTAASLIRQLAESSKYMEYKGEKVKQSSLFAYASELAVFMQEVFGNITELLTTFYDCQPNNPKTPWIHKTVGDGGQYIYGPCLNILGASTQAWLSKCIPRSEMEGGFTSRVIFVVENNLPDALVAWPQLHPKIEAMRACIVEDMQAISKLSGPFHVENEAKIYFHYWYEDHMKNKMVQNLDPRMIGYMSRKGDTILKLAMIRSVSLGNSMTVTIDHMKWAETELDALEPDWRGAFGGLNVKDGLAWDLRNYLRMNSPSTRASMIANFTGQYPIGEIAISIDELFDMGEAFDWKFPNGIPGISNRPQMSATDQVLRDSQQGISQPDPEPPMQSQTLDSDPPVLQEIQ